ncbi:class Ib ribonucleoside-diphosphate reductase assembly flavoprotein NrdI [Zafaria sp. Z1313]|uniref:class Ib ribonucleoside-diphosphate reductase assembly flavoprotein NrdI n=1 Tax=unclassified Zafaria TaxID=2828765 RepID=UPI002E76C2D8|nr:class Ib ribonucleoside-diphosphate reductase assembly flavoprotein NrdI [Zafaria sp. J156]MEE1622491.1 class Ib ribonucleoside-diphosphate reductase assembly flavoprotein NrdI [Zafaria sp. J156]
MPLGAPAAAAPSTGTEPEETTGLGLVYFSSVSGYTARFIDKVGLDAARIPLYPHEPRLVATEPFVLVLPTYGGEEGRHSVPPQVVRFLNDERNRSLLRGVIGAGNTNFGTAYCLAARKISAKCGVPLLYRFELMGTPEDVSNVRQGLEEFWTQQSQSRP